MDEDDLEIEDLFANKKKKIKSGKKGKRVELEIVKDLNERFHKVLVANPDLGKFSRSVGSGNRWGQNVYLSKKAKDIYSGDLTCPDNFKFVVESKGGYNDIDLCSAFDNGVKDIDNFLKQVTDDSERTGRKPLLFWKKDRKPRLAFLKKTDIDENALSTQYKMYYKDWIVINYKVLMNLPDDYFFDLNK